MDWPSTKAPRVLAALLRIGWRVKREGKSSLKVLEKPGLPAYIWHFHDGVTIGPVMLKKIAKRTGLAPDDL